MKLEDISRAASQRMNSLNPSSYYKKTPNEKCANLVDIIFDKILDLMSKDTKKSSIEKSFIIRGAKNLKDPVKRFIMLNMSMEDAKELVDKAKREIED